MPTRTFSPSRLLGVTAIVLATLGAFHCSSSGDSSSKVLAPTSAVVGAQGGSLASSDDSLRLEIPAGALDGDVNVSITPTTTTVGGSVGQVFELGPAGTTFKVPIKVTFRYGGVDLKGGAPTKLYAATVEGSAWRALDGRTLDEAARTVAGTTTHFSIYGMYLAAGGNVCVKVRGGSACPSGVGGDGTPCPTSTCADNDLCAAQYPGSTESECVDEAPTPGGGSMFTATCCVTGDQPFCVHASRSASGVAGAAVPRCASTSNACEGYPGTTGKDCVDSELGFDVSCCYPPGTVPPAADAGSAGVGPVGSSNPPPPTSGSTATPPPTPPPAPPPPPK